MHGHGRLMGNACDQRAAPAANGRTAATEARVAKKFAESTAMEGHCRRHLMAGKSGVSTANAV
jgi:hypothetical protein